jgi:hypothetical protein
MFLAPKSPRRYWRKVVVDEFTILRVINSSKYDIRVSFTKPSKGAGMPMRTGWLWEQDIYMICPGLKTLYVLSARPLEIDRHTYVINRTPYISLELTDG